MQNNQVDNHRGGRGGRGRGRGGRAPHEPHPERAPRPQQDRANVEAPPGGQPAARAAAAEPLAGAVSENLPAICAICQYALVDQLRSQLSKLQPCGHYFHSTCFEIYLAGRGLNPNCPVCRADFRSVDRITPARPAPARAPVVAAPAVPPVLRGPVVELANNRVVADCRLTPPDIQALQSVFPSITFVSTSHRREHPQLRTARLVHEAMAVEQILLGRQEGEWIMDVGGNSNRHELLGRAHIHSCRPVLLPNDARSMNDARGHFCRHTAQICTCQAFSAAMFIHSIYYLSPEEVITVLRRCTQRAGISVHHRFAGAQGTILESNWHRVGNRINMRATGNSSAYEHSDLSWLDQPYYRSSGPFSLTWRVHHTDSVAEILFLALVETDQLPVPVLETKPLLEAIMSRTPCAVDIRGLMAKESVVNHAPLVRNVKTAKIDVEKDGKTTLCLATAEVTYRVPVGLIGAVGMAMLNKNRQEDAYAIGMLHARSLVRQYPLTELEMLAAVPLSVVIAMEYSLSLEVTALERLEQNTSDSWWYWGLNSVYQRVRARVFRPIGHTWSAFLRRKWEEFTDALPRIVARFIAAITAYLAARRWFRRSVGSAFWELLAKLWKWLKGKLSSAERSRPTRSLPWTARRHVHDTPNGVQLFAPEVARPGHRDHNRLPNADVCLGPYRSLTQMHSTAAFGPPPLQPACVPKFGNQLVGFALPFVAPVVSRSCHHNLTIAIVNRALMDRPGPIITVWEAFRNFVFRELGVLLPVKEFDGQMLPRFDRKKWLKRFPGSKAYDYSVALDNVKAGLYPVKRDGKATGFVKRENLIRLFLTGLQPYDPRLIQAQTYEDQAAAAPFTYCFSKYLAVVWGALVAGENVMIGEIPPSVLLEVDFSPVVYASMCNAVQLGSWFSWALRQPYACVVGGDDRLLKLGQNWCSSDHPRYDAHVHEEALDLKIAVYYRRGLRRGTDASKAIEGQRRVRGGTRDGHRYSIDATVQSGKPDTTGGNSLLNGLKAHFARSLLFPSTNSSAYDKVNTDLGFPIETEVSEHPWDAEFFSSIFLPTTTGFRLTPKPGRQLAKLFYTLVPMDAKKRLEWLKGVVIGVLPLMNHVPGVRAVFWRLRDLTAEVTHTRPYRLPDVYLGVEQAEACPETFDYMRGRYDLSLSEIADMESEAHDKKLGDTLNSIGWKKLYDRDIDEPEVQATVPILHSSSVLWTVIQLRIAQVLFWVFDRPGKLGDFLENWTIGAALVLRPILTWFRAIDGGFNHAWDALCTGRVHQHHWPGWLSLMGFIMMIPMPRVSQVLIAPFWEEGVKRLWLPGGYPLSGAIFGLFEGLLNNVASGINIGRTINHLVFHTLTAMFPYRFAVLFHLLNNIVAIAQGALKAKALRNPLFCTLTYRDLVKRACQMWNPREMRMQDGCCLSPTTFGDLPESIRVTLTPGINTYSVCPPNNDQFLCWVLWFPEHPVAVLCTGRKPTWEDLHEFCGRPMM